MWERTQTHGKKERKIDKDTDRQRQRNIEIYRCRHRVWERRKK